MNSLRKWALAIGLIALLGAPLAFAAATTPPQKGLTGYRTIDGGVINALIDYINGVSVPKFGSTGGFVIGSTTVTESTFTALPTNGVGGVGSGYKLARGETALDGSNPTPVTTGLTAIVGCTATIKLATAPGTGTSVVTYGTSGGTLNLYGWKVTSSSDTTLIASTGTETVGWVCVGT